MTILSAFFWGLVGGMLAEFMGWYKLRYTFHKKKPDWTKSPFYWFMTVSMILIGGGVAAAYVHFGTQLTEFLAVNVGATAPLIITRATAADKDIIG